MAENTVFHTLRDKGRLDFSEAKNEKENEETHLPSPSTSRKVKTLGESLNKGKGKEEIVSFKDIDLKVYNDPVHGHIQTNKVCQLIVDTPQFQRLRFLRQLGMGYFVFPGAAHNRFEHSLGTCYLAGIFVRTLRSNQPFLGITERDILCVEIAALCHDLGHGILSHFYDQHFMRKYKEECIETREERSVMMFEYLLSSNNLYREDGSGILSTTYKFRDKDIEFIKEQILGKKKYNDNGKWALTGRGKEKEYLYEIVSNKRNGIDVDKFDCIARDCHHLGIKNNFDYFRYMKFARVIEVDGQMQICSREKELNNLYNMFYTRYTLYKLAYQHKVKIAIEAMVNKALEIADPHMELEGFRKKTYQLSECHKDPAALMRLTDNILFEILYSNDAKLAESKKMIERIFSRKLYQTAFESKIILPDDLEQYGGENEDDIKNSIIKEVSNKLKDKDFIVDIVRRDFELSENYSLDRLNVYRKGNVYQASQLKPNEMSKILAPRNEREVEVRVYCTSTDEAKVNVIKDACQQVLHRNRLVANQ
ncbi:deoxynucleoside triphosphate triphosphohydrolase SAMHD1-like [Physella acuta]|uniref:deoxynucleoside triphosphate triphosphohydrolase SAMHD1-like n=1 Tax=Physella acuta TaxID=109671 RepID=UPI0027DC7275|nr:deoxynucleoside triphosphate triphosphohydrolase SAMHD1-like [Physella acuta]XP_059152296.1 deoxynucleoside triphosphate triphosphohydrolase SAMHD1-like [Physella acuta]